MSSAGTTVTIDGMKFTFSSDENKDKTIKIAEYVDSKISEIRKGNNKLNPVNLYTLALMNITGELFEKESKYDQLVEESKEPIQRFQTISKEVDKITREKTELENSLSKLKSDLIESLNKISDMNVTISKLEEENKKKNLSLESKSQQITELNLNLKNLQKENIELQKALEENLKAIQGL